MIKHLFKLVWKRKRSNALLILEIFISFLVLSVMVTLAIHFGGLYSTPKGFTHENILHIAIQTFDDTDDVWTPEDTETTQQLLLALQSMPQVENVASVLYGPYAVGGSSGPLQRPNGEIIQNVGRDEVTDAFAEVVDLQLVAGRWFSPEDNGQSWRPVVLTQQLSDDLFPNMDPLGQNIAPQGAARELRVVGVSSPYRPFGEYGQQVPFVFVRTNLQAGDRPPRNVLVRLNTETNATFESHVLNTLSQRAPQWSFEVVPLSEKRALAHRFFITPMAALATVVIFLLMMVGLGLAGVLWQNVTARTAEMGLRRALGGTLGDIRAQILGELLVLTTIAMLLGAAVFLQAPLLGLFSLPLSTYLLSLAASIVLIAGFVVVCGLYPSHLATRIQPAEALHYE